MKYFIGIYITFFLSQAIYSQTRIIGKITTINKVPVPNTSVTYFNKQIGSITDLEGNFTIRKIIGDTLRISSIGYKTKIIAIDIAVDTLDIELESNYNRLQEVVVIARKKTTSIITLGHIGERNFIAAMHPHFERAVFIPNSNSIQGYINEIKFQLDDFKNKPFALRIRSCLS